VGADAALLEYVFWVDDAGNIVLNRFPGLDPHGAQIGLYTPFTLAPFPAESARRPVPGTSRLTTGGTTTGPKAFWVGWVGADGTVRLQQHDAITMLGPAQPLELGTARPDSALASADLLTSKAFAWVTPERRIAVLPGSSQPDRPDLLGDAGSVRADTPIGLAAIGSLHNPNGAVVVWVAADGTVMSSVRFLTSTIATGWSQPTPLRDETGAPALAAGGDTLAVTTDTDAVVSAAWVDPTGALQNALFTGTIWKTFKSPLPPGSMRVNGPLRVVTEFLLLQVIFATPSGGVGVLRTAPTLAVPQVLITLAGPEGGGTTEVAISRLGRNVGSTMAAWRSADGRVNRTRLPHAAGASISDFSPPQPGPLPTVLPAMSDDRVDPVSARCELRLRHPGSVDAFWVRPDGALGILAARDIPDGRQLPAGWRWRAAAVARPGLARTSPPGAVARLVRDPNGFALLWVQADGSVRHIAFDGAETVESPKWRLPAQIAPPGSAATTNPAVAATPGPSGGPAGEEWAFWLTPARKIGLARRDAANPVWQTQVIAASAPRADSTLLAGAMPGRVTLVWIDAGNVAVFASKAGTGDWVLVPVPSATRSAKVAPRARLVAAPVDASAAGGTRIAWIDIDGIVRAATFNGTTWGEIAQLSDPGVDDAASLTVLQADAALAWVLPDGTVAQQGTGLVTGPAAASTVLGSVPPPGSAPTSGPAASSLVVATPDGNLGILSRGGS
jgi:hypothetical protein